MRGYKGVAQLKKSEKWDTLMVTEFLYCLIMTSDESDKRRGTNKQMENFLGSAFCVFETRVIKSLSSKYDFLMEI